MILNKNTENRKTFVEKTKFNKFCRFYKENEHCAKKCTAKKCTECTVSLLDFSEKMRIWETGI